MPTMKFTPITSLAVVLTLTGAAVGQTKQSRDQALIDDLVIANHILASQGVLDGFGHVSIRNPGNPNHYFVSRSLAPGLVTAADIIEYDLDSNPIGDTRSSYTERYIHGEIYKVRPDVMAIVHAHSSAVIPFSVSSVPLRAVSHMAAFIGEGVPVFEIRNVEGMTNMLISNSKRGQALAKVLGNSAAVLMRGHGEAVVGEALKEVVCRAIYLDTNARLEQQAILLGGKITYLDPDETKKAGSGSKGGFDRAWDLWKQNDSVRH
jgi:ribulose-5-phosphate 4-epimerase/fuculose-1-phosphate aldolase